MFWIPGKVLAEQVTRGDFERRLIYPHKKDILEDSVNLALRIVKNIFLSRLPGVKKPKDICTFINRKILILV